MPSVVVSLPQLGVKPGGWEKNKEIYVLSLAADLRGAENREQAFAAAANETLPILLPELASLDATNWVLVAASNVFERIRPDQPVSLSGSGILLYPNLDPKGMLALYFVIVESDAGTRNLGKLLSGILSHSDIRGIISALRAQVTQPLIGALMNTMISQIPLLLARNKDDILLCHNHSGFDFDHYGVTLQPEVRHRSSCSTFTDFRIANDRAYCTLRLRVNSSIVS